ncbi:GMC oxidoreductase [Streptomyces acidicola]|uniref:GMC oxidoreductase n=1 Tax=Streptomyces acidicola TaxID=2596892 RepID=UPI003416DB48
MYGIGTTRPVRLRHQQRDPTGDHNTRQALGGTVEYFRSPPAGTDRPRCAHAGYLGAPGAYRRLREAVRVITALLDTPLAALSGGLFGLGREVLYDDRALDRWIRDHLDAARHTCGTVPEGPAEDLERAAIDQFGRVHGVSGLRVAGTSLLPDAPQRGPAATAVLVGELVADAMRRDLT